MARRKIPAKTYNYLPAERDALMQTILARVMEGEDLKAICSEPDIPAFRTVYYWLEQDPELEFAYRRARRGYAACQAAKATVLADRLARLEVPKDGVRGIEVAIKHYQWLAERMDPSTWAPQQPKAPAAAIQIITNAFETPGESAQMIVIEEMAKPDKERRDGR